MSAYDCKCGTSSRDRVCDECGHVKWTGKFPQLRDVIHEHMTLVRREAVKLSDESVFHQVSDDHVLVVKNARMGMTQEVDK